MRRPNWFWTFWAECTSGGSDRALPYRLRDGTSITCAKQVLAYTGRALPSQAMRSCRIQPHPEPFAQDPAIWHPSKSLNRLAAHRTPPYPRVTMRAKREDLSNRIDEVAAATIMPGEEFVRRFSVRAPGLVWFLGAGASSSAGVPSAMDLIWDFKRLLYCTSQKIPLRAVQDLLDPQVRRRLQIHFDRLRSFPAEDADTEYAAYFEAAFPAEADRRRYMDQVIAGRTPAFGHIALAALVALEKINVIATTNFDRLVEDALSQQFRSTSAFAVATVDNAALAMESLNALKRPLCLKLHGDFLSSRLKNTESELRNQDGNLRFTLVESCKRFGLVVIGYSGRDHSVMDALEEAIDDGRGYPNGLFWFRRPDAPLLPRVLELQSRAQQVGIEASLVEIQTFDEVMADLLELEHDLPEELRALLDRRARLARDSQVPKPSQRGWPVVRFNALPIIETPSLLRRVVCDIGGTAEVRQAIGSANADIIGCRSRAGVLAIGSDSEVRRCFEPFGITEFTLHDVVKEQLGRESAERGLLLDALIRGIARERSLLAIRRGRRQCLIPCPENIPSPQYETLRRAARGIRGKVDGTDIAWSEALRIRLDYRLGRMWLILLPGLWVDLPPVVDGSIDAGTMQRVRDFQRERLATRYNRIANALLDGWIAVLFGDTEDAVFRSLGISDGVDASFRLARRTAFCRPEESS